MNDLETTILKSIIKKKSESELFDIKSLNPVKISLNLRQRVTFSFLVRDSESIEEYYTLPSDESINQLVNNLNGKELDDYHKLESKLDPIQLKAAVGLAFTH